MDLRLTIAITVFNTFAKFDKKIMAFFLFDKTLDRPFGLSTTLPLSTDGHDRPLVRLALPGAPSTEFIVDTGSVTSAIPGVINKKIPSLATGHTWVTTLEGLQSVSEVLLEQLPLGRFSVPLVELNVRKDLSQGLLGLNILTRYLVTLDPNKGELLLEPRLGFQSHLVGNVGDVQLLVGLLKVTEVRERMAEKAGIEAGDRILSIDGESTQKMSYVEAYWKFNGYEGTQATLELEKANGKEVAVHFRRRTDYASLVRSELGMLLIQDKGKPAKVIWVDRDTEAFRAGI